MAATPARRELREVFADIIDGRIVKRAKHVLRWDSSDVSAEFIEALNERGYRSMTVHDADVQPGERAPAFFVRDGTAYFGWVFWEKFTNARLRKLFGSIVRNAKGDWAIQIPDGRSTLLYVNVALRTEMDIENPSGF